MNVLHINTWDSGGGAGDFANEMVHSFMGNQNLLVKNKHIESSRIFEFPKYPRDHFFFILDRIFWKFKIKKTFKGIFSLSEELNSTYKKLQSNEIYKNADIIHLHNIHGGFFDLDALIDIANEKPIIWSLHDMWALTGGEAFTFENKNYIKGIGKTPYHTNYPLYSPLVDRRQHYIEKKKRIYNSISSKITFVPACDWLENCLKGSYVFNPQMLVHRIYYGINQDIFVDHKLRSWNIPRILIVNSGNPFKGESIFKSIFNKIGAKGKFELYVIGKKLNITSNIEVKYFDYIKNKNELAKMFNEVDIFIFPSLAENFPLTTLMAMFCGVCVIAAKTGGLPEQLQESNGFLYEPNNEEDLLTKISIAIDNISNTRMIGSQASDFSNSKFNSKLMLKNYQELYDQVYKH